MKSLKQIEYLGWGFFAFLFLVFVGPAIYLALNYTYETATVATRVGLGVVCALVASGIIIWPINEIMNRMHLKKVAAERKAERKRKKRTKK